MGALANIGPSVAQEAAVYLKDVDEALRIGENVVSAAIVAHEATRDLFGGAAEHSEEAYTLLAQSLGQIVGRGTGMLASLYEQGLIQADQLEVQSDHGELTIKFDQTESDEETDSDVAVQDPPIDDTPSPEHQLTDDTSTKSGEVDPEISEMRVRQHGMLTDIFGEDKSDVIESLTQDEIVEIGRLVEVLYQRTPIGHRGKADQPKRARQFAEYIAGKDPEEMANEYGITAQGIHINLRKAVDILHRDKSKVDLAPILDKAVAQMRIVS